MFFEIHEIGRDIFCHPTPTPPARGGKLMDDPHTQGAALGWLLTALLGR